jgi:hypothetical protein
METTPARSSTRDAVVMLQRTGLTGGRRGTLAREWATDAAGKTSSQLDSGLARESALPTVALRSRLPWATRSRATVSG